MNDNSKLRSFLSDPGLFDLLREFEDYYPSSAWPTQFEISVMEVDQIKESKERTLITHVLEESESEYDFDRFRGESNDEDVAEVQNRKASSSATTVASLQMIVAPAMPAVTPSVKTISYNTSWRTIGKANSQNVLASPKVKASKVAKSLQPVMDDDFMMLRTLIL
ncbi:hypothetical protein EVAR_86110_1 [Eumeta japonica]|uniref:Uncharacterized protein n=1 Tax=Eumeta variegata TaxID=151549 RepID=A0A4C1V0J7_EUMVA|nr:hypothetical protein EVAR_86110_1 [Eumeta japonica]